MRDHNDTDDHPPGTVEEQLAALRDTIAELRRKLGEERHDRREAEALAAKMRERLEESGEDHDRYMQVLDSDIEVFQQWDAMVAENEELIRENKRLRRLVPKQGAMPRDPGRPLAASPAQVQDVLARLKQGESIRTVAANTGLSVRTVRTIRAQRDGTDPAREREKLIRKREFNRQRNARWRASKKERDSLPRRCADWKREAGGLLKAAKGLGRLE